MTGLKTRARELKAHLHTRAFLTQRYGTEFDSQGRARCLCPERHANGDTTPSFTVDDDGRCQCWSQHCFGEKPTDVYGVIQAKDGVGFAEAVRAVAEYAGGRVNGNGAVHTLPSSPPSPGANSPQGSESRLVTEYIFSERDGSDVLKKCRYEHADGSKSFAQYSSDGNGGWVKGAKGVVVPLYRLPEVIEGDDPVVVVEGEKCVEALRGIGVNATTFTGGSGKFTQEHAEQLSGREVVVWADNDEPGRLHGERVCEVSGGVVASLRCVEPPDWLPKGGDVVDVLDVKGGDEVHHLVDGAQQWTPPPAERDETKARRTVCMHDVEPEETDWLWAPRIPKGNLTLLFGDGGVGKSHVTLSIATALSRGEGLPGVEGTGSPTNSVIFTGEDRLGELRRRLDGMDAETRHVFACGEPFGLDADGLSFVERSIAEHAAEFVVIDPVVAFLGKDLDFYRANETRSILAPLAEVADRTQAAVVLVTHVTKGAAAKAAHRALGSADFTNAARSALLAGADPDHPDQCALCHEKANLGPKAPPLGYSIKDGRFTWTGETELTASRLLGAGDGDQGGGCREAEAFLRELLSEGSMAAKEVATEAEAAGIAKQTLRRARERICVVRKDGFKGGWLWELRPDEDVH